MDRELLPNFIIGGAPRSGTTFLSEALDRHPEVRMARPVIPEPKVFFGPQPDEAGYRARYAELFAGANGEKALGEKTSNYFESPQACERIGRFLPQVRMLFILREPVSRAYSNYLWSTKNGLETLPFEEAVALEGQRASPLPPEKSHARPFDYLLRGDYDVFAERYLKTLGRQRLRFVLYEDIERRPEGLLKEVQEFLGVEPLAFAHLDVGVVNSAREIGPPLDRGVEARLKERMALAVRRLMKLTDMDLAVWGY
jgi:hypothetical protein